MEREREKKDRKPRDSKFATPTIASCCPLLVLPSLSQSVVLLVYWWLLHGWLLARSGAIGSRLALIDLADGRQCALL